MNSVKEALFYRQFLHSDGIHRLFSKEALFYRHFLHSDGTQACFKRSFILWAVFA